MRYFNVSVCPVSRTLYPPFISTGSQYLGVFGMTGEEFVHAETSVLRNPDDARKLGRICPIATRTRRSTKLSHSPIFPASG